ncbi:MAG: translocase, partial [Paracoccaceae bacterium]
PASAAAGEGGFLVRLGDADAPDAMMAEIYSFPRAASEQAGTPRVSIEAEVTEGNCEREITAQTLGQNGKGEIAGHDLNFFMPDCEALGDFLVLKNLPEDLNIASN